MEMYDQSEVQMHLKFVEVHASLGHGPVLEIMNVDRPHRDSLPGNTSE
jgi:hypothetical protein